MSLHIFWATPTKPLATLKLPERECSYASDMPIVTSQMSKELEKTLKGIQQRIQELEEVIDAIHQYVSSTRSEVQDTLAVVTQINRRILDIEDVLRKLVGSENLE
jgi:septal ring factor EnvC (AmiA/AmiB activator)